MQAIVVTDDPHALQPVEHGEDAGGEPRRRRRLGGGPGAA
jgi:hypothetical protein